MAGSGKSTIGSALAKRLNFSFTDLDVYIAEKAHQTIQSIIDTQGEDTLLQLEEQRMHEIDLESRVIAPGGSIVYHTDLMEYLKNSSVLVYLKEDFRNIEARVKAAPSRGIVGMKHKSLKQIYDERQPLYSRYAHMTISAAGKSREQLVNEIVERLKDLN